MEGNKIARKTFLRTLGGAALGVGLFAWLRGGKTEQAQPLAGGEATNKPKLLVRRDDRAVSREAWDSRA